MTYAHLRRPVSVAFLFIAFLLLTVMGATGCGSTQGTTASSPAVPTAQSLQGSVFGGQQPIAGATIQLYAAGTPTSGGGYGQGATGLINGPLPTTNSGGSFTITGLYTPPSTPSYFYIVATGGSPGFGNPANPDIVLMAAITTGSCTPASSLSSSMFININEVTTAAAVLALQPFVAAPTGTTGAPVLIGAPAANVNDLRSAFQTAANLASMSSGAVVNPTGRKGQIINTLADVLASCVNSDPASALPNPCSRLFAAATPGGALHTAADTVQAAWYIAQNPTSNTSPLWLLIPPSPPFVALGSAPASFAVSGTADSLTCVAVLGGTSVVNTGPTVVTGGDLGVYPGATITGFPPGTVTAPATIHSGDTEAQSAQTNLTAAYVYAQGLPGALDLTGQDLGGLTLTPGVYKFAAAAQLTGALTLNASADPEAVFVFQIGSTLTTASGSQVSLTNGAKAQNVFWQVGSSATLGTTTAFRGTILAHTSITANTGASIQGRALANFGTTTLDTNAITAP